MWIEAIKSKPRSRAAAQGFAVIGFAILTVLAYVQNNYILSALFTLLAVYYFRKLMKASSTQSRPPERLAAPVDVDAVQDELRAMRVYYRRLKKGWLWAGGIGWGCTALMLSFAPSTFLLIVVGLAGYASYAYVRCRNAIRLIEAGLGEGVER